MEEVEDARMTAFVNDMNDTKQAIVNLLETLKKMNSALAVISDNQNHLNAKLNTMMKVYQDNKDNNNQ